MYLDEKSFTSPPVEIKPDIYALPTFIAWAERQPANKEYNYGDCRGACLLGQYMRDHGVGWKNFAYINFLGRAEGGTDVWQGKIAVVMPWTMGAATARARALLP